MSKKAIQRGVLSTRKADGDISSWLESFEGVDAKEGDVGG